MARPASATIGGNIGHARIFSAPPKLGPDTCIETSIAATIQIEAIYAQSYPMTLYAIMLSAGIGIPIPVALNAALGQTIGSPAAAAVVLFVIVLTVTGVVALVTGPSALAKAASAPPHLFLAGVSIAFYVLTVTYIAPHFGVGNAVFFVPIGQLFGAAAIDHFGLFGAQASPLSPTGAGGIALMALGVWVAQQA